MKNRGVAAARHFRCVLTPTPNFFPRLYKTWYLMYPGKSCRFSTFVIIIKADIKRSGNQVWKQSEKKNTSPKSQSSENSFGHKIWKFIWMPSSYNVKLFLAQSVKICITYKWVCLANEKSGCKKLCLVSCTDASNLSNQV